MSRFTAVQSSNLCLCQKCGLNRDLEPLPEHCGHLGYTVALRSVNSLVIQDVRSVCPSLPLSSFCTSRRVSSRRESSMNEVWIPKNKADSIQMVPSYGLLVQPRHFTGKQTAAGRGHMPDPVSLSQYLAVSGHVWGLAVPTALHTSTFPWKPHRREV